MTTIPSEAIQAACHAYRYPNRMITNTSDGRHNDCMTAALEAAMPYLHPRPLPTREQVADVILGTHLFGDRTPIAAADAVLQLLTGGDQ